MNTKIIDKNYGSIPHLSTSKLTQQADKKIDFGSEKILTKKARDWKDLIIVTEKVDGSNVGVIKKSGELYGITRKGYDCRTSPFKQHHYFNDWITENENIFSWLPDGHRIAGEWCIKPHGTLYDITHEQPFLAFDIFDKNNKRIVYTDFLSLCSKFCIPIVPLLHIGQPISIKNAIKKLGNGHYGNTDKPEGFVYRCEREGRVDFLAKWVRDDKEDGKYMKDNLYNIGFKR